MFQKLKYCIICHIVSYNTYCFIVNTANKVGAVGFIPFIGEPFYPVTLIRVDPDTNEPIRGENNLCIKCQVGKILV